jgi:hypothetical protein
MGETLVSNVFFDHESILCISCVFCVLLNDNTDAVCVRIFRKCVQVWMAFKQCERVIRQSILLQHSTKLHQIQLYSSVTHSFIFVLDFWRKNVDMNWMQENNSLTYFLFSHVEWVCYDCIQISLVYNIQYVMRKALPVFSNEFVFPKWRWNFPHPR